MKKITAFLLSALFLLQLAACGGPTETTVQDEVTEPVTNAPETSTPETSAPETSALNHIEMGTITKNTIKARTSNTIPTTNPATFNANNEYILSSYFFNLYNPAVYTDDFNFFSIFYQETFALRIVNFSVDFDFARRA